MPSNADIIGDLERGASRRRQQYRRRPRSRRVPIVGFQVMNRHGLVVFAENTYLTYADRPVPARAGQSIKARFRFQLPFLPTGDYGITIALADGTQTEAVQQHWLDDAMFFRVTSSHVVRGLCGVPMLNIELEAG